jgi:hypothetical protein
MKVITVTVERTQEAIIDIEVEDDETVSVSSAHSYLSEAHAWPESGEWVTVSMEVVAVTYE